MEKIIINRIAEFRKPLGLSQHRLAKAVGLKRQTIISYENNRTYPTLDMALRIAQVLKRDFSEVFIID